MALAVLFTLDGVARYVALPSGRLGFDILLKDPWAVPGVLLIACAYYSYVCMERTLKELGEPWAPVVVPLGVTTRYRKRCRHESRTP
jgi:hypothetical protein